jgi:hypothetical protein
MIGKEHCATFGKRLAERYQSRCWRGLFALADQLEQRLAQARRQVDQLTPSLLARAFAGKLVPQNPADEPADKLLECIHATVESKSQRDVAR